MGHLVEYLENQTRIGVAAGMSLQAAIRTAHIEIKQLVDPSDYSEFLKLI